MDEKSKKELWHLISFQSPSLCLACAWRVSSVCRDTRPLRVQEGGCGGLQLIYTLAAAASVLPQHFCVPEAIEVDLRMRCSTSSSRLGPLPSRPSPASFVSRGVRSSRPAYDPPCAASSSSSSSTSSTTCTSPTSCSGPRCGRALSAALKQSRLRLNYAVATASISQISNVLSSALKEELLATTAERSLSRSSSVSSDSDDDCMPAVARVGISSRFAFPAASLPTSPASLDLALPEFRPRDYAGPAAAPGSCVLVCQGSKCRAKGALEVLQAASAVVGASPSVEVLPCKCLGRCGQGAAMRVLSPNSDIPGASSCPSLTPALPASSSCPSQPVLAGGDPMQPLALSESAPAGDSHQPRNPALLASGRTSTAAGRGHLHTRVLANEVGALLDSYFL